jgi:hypothetical protein
MKQQEEITLSKMRQYEEQCIELEKKLQSSSNEIKNLKEEQQNDVSYKIPPL